MEQNILENVFANMNYKTYKKLNKVSNIGSIYAIANPFVVGVLEAPIAEIALITYCIASQCYFLTTLSADCEKYTKEISEITNLYNILIDNYVKFNNTFELKNPIEIYRLYNYMLYRGYLSKDGEFYFGHNNIGDINSLLGVNVVTGNAVCRHISSMLNDIYQKLNINSCTCSAYLNENDSMIILLDKQISLLKSQLNLTIDDREKELLQKLLIDIKKLRNNLKPKFDFLNRRSSNHMINLVSQDDIGYIIDPTNKHIYKKDSDITNMDKDILNSYVISSENTILKLTKKRGEYDKKREILLLPNSSDEEDKKIITKINSLCIYNRDIFEKFKIENNDLYNEINNNLVKIKKK